MFLFCNTMTYSVTITLDKLGLFVVAKNSFLPFLYCKKTLGTPPFYGLTKLTKPCFLVRKWGFTVRYKAIFDDGDKFESFWKNNFCPAYPNDSLSKLLSSLWPKSTHAKKFRGLNSIIIFAAILSNIELYFNGLPFLLFFVFMPFFLFWK